MLANGLGKLLKKECEGRKRFVDLFCGSGSVSHYMAEHSSLPVVAVDLQKYSTMLSNAIINRTDTVEPSIFDQWLSRINSKRIKRKFRNMEYKENHCFKEYAEQARMSCAQSRGYITKAYGGHYFSPQQALTLDVALETAPQRQPDYTMGIAALIVAASKCAAAPGHTAQPLNPYKKASKFVRRAWENDILIILKNTLINFSQRKAQKRGGALVSNANDFAKEVRRGDLVFIDPPYSEVQYSRFYHVLETIAQGRCSKVSGVGRYPPQLERPRSEYSLRSQSSKALESILDILSSKGCKVVMTFPRKECSNGLSGDQVISLSEKYFRNVATTTPDHAELSTLGGFKDTKRGARQVSTEMILTLSTH